MRVALKPDLMTAAPLPSAAVHEVAAKFRTQFGSVYDYVAAAIDQDAFHHDAQ